MRTIVTETQAYTFHELDDDIKEKVIEKYYDINVCYAWHDFTYSDMKKIGDMLGIDIDDIHFSGFCSQGDGARFVGRYEYRKGAHNHVMSEFPTFTELHRIAKELQDIQRRYFYQITAKVTLGHNSNFYCHENTVSIEVYDAYGYWIKDKDAEIVSELLRDFMRLIYSTLEKEYDYLTSEETIIETIEANEYEFTKKGEIV